jgi:hypothetical protein
VQTSQGVVHGDQIRRGRVSTDGRGKIAFSDQGQQTLCPEPGKEYESKADAPKDAFIPMDHSFLRPVKNSIWPGIRWQGTVLSLSSW